jgi:hypothetical protein
MDDRNVEVYEEDELDFENVVLRRSDPDDCD